MLHCNKAENHMAGLRDTLAMLTALRRKLEQALGEASHPLPAASLSAGRLREVADFGSNPGQLRMLIHVPADLPARPALLVGLHGCTQSAVSYDTGSGWSTLAGRTGFVALFPEQQQSNNPNRCFNWFAAEDTRRASGEVLSIRQMIDHAVSAHDIDPDRIFVTGLSAGGAMASSLLAAYPELFAAGAIVAGLPHGSAGNLAEALDAMSKGRERTSRQWGDIVRSSSSHQGPWPRLSVWHGSGDSIVRPTNAEASVLQWASVHGVPVIPSNDTTSGNHRVRTWLGESGETVIEAHTIAGMGHGVPLALNGNVRSGQAGPFHFNVGVASPRRILSFFGISEEREPAHDQAFLAAAENMGSGALSGAKPASATERDGIFEVLQKAGVMNSTVTGRRQHPPLSHKVQDVINSALRTAGLLK
jgi:poly(hydroxyalkanoate) depolymerase family esterase